MNIITDTSQLTNTVVLASASGVDLGAVMAATLLALASVLAFVAGWFIAAYGPIGRSS